jgi:hypothetical protein
MTDTHNSCVVCGGTKDLVPLFLDPIPAAQPVTWIHLASLAPETVADDSTDIAAAFQNLRDSPRRQQVLARMRQTAKKDD